MDPLQPTQKMHIFRTGLVAVVLILMASASSLYSEPLVEEIVASSVSIADSTATTGLTDSLAATTEISTEPTTYALIAGGLFLSLLIFKRKLGVNSQTKISESE